MTAPDAAQLVENAQQWQAKNWWRLELALFRDAPRVKSQLDVLAPRDVWAEDPGRVKGRGCLQSLPYLYALAASVVCVLAIIAWFINGRIDELPVRLIGILTLIVLVWVTLSDAIRGRGVLRFIGWRAVLTTTLFRIVPDALTLLVAWQTDPDLLPSDAGIMAGCRGGRSGDSDCAAGARAVAPRRTSVLPGERASSDRGDGFVRA